MFRTQGAFQRAMTERTHRRFLVAAVAAGALAAAAASPALAAPSLGGFASDNVEWVKNIPTHADTAGGRLLGKHFYVTTERDLTIYDVTDPVNPSQVGHLFFSQPGEPYFPEEDPDTNGKILLVGNQGVLTVIDVSDKANPHEIGQVSGADNHTISCVLDCTWAYGSSGVIVDLRDPTKPKVAGEWRASADDAAHDVTEVAPGLVLTASGPIRLLDARDDPVHPRVLATSATGMGPYTGPFVHGVLWPNLATDEMLLVGGEGLTTDCAAQGGEGFQTWSTRDWRTTGRFTMLDEFHVAPGLFTSGRSPVNIYCAHWFDVHPTFRNGGLVAMSWYEQGVHFLKVAPNGKIDEVGWFLPHAGSASGAYWITDRVVYSTDYNRGLDILRFTGDIAPPGPPSAPQALPPTPTVFADYVAFPSAKRCIKSTRLRVRVRRRAEDPATAVTVKVNGRTAGRSKGGSVAVRRPRRGRFTVAVTVQTRSKRTLSGSRRYRACSAGTSRR